MNHSYHLPGLRVSADLMWLDSQGEGFWLLTRVEVGQEIRGQGYGSQLLKVVCDAADKEGAHLELMACPDHSFNCLEIDALIDWYERNGFQVWDKFDDSPLVTMVRFPAKNTRLDPDISP
ncbi:MAG: GNAT family N-acetyltransferase [Actinobacteria bacterium]|nr:GNAT family N-acetyltransferase [Actinomycetota bacterium]MCA1807239.1 GNAT family N-acetyltransferase [Actinomycetota bacterium]